MMPLKLPYPSMLLYIRKETLPDKLDHLVYLFVLLEEQPQDIVISAIGWVDNPNGKGFISQFSMCVITPEGNMLHEEELSDVTKDSMQALKNYVGNFLNLLNSTNADTTIPAMTRQARRRMERHGELTDPKQTYIGIDMGLRRYVLADRIASGMHGTHRRHWVRGHWRHLDSEWYKAKKGQLTWVRPHLAGELGDMRDKEYMVKK
jgi:hypothetical protein